MSLRPKPATPREALSIRQLLDHLKSFRPMCIKPGQDRDEAMFYAGKVELANYILTHFDPEEDTF